MLSNGSNSEVISIIFEGDAPPKDALAEHILNEFTGAARCIEADVFTYSGLTLVIARNLPPLRNRFSPRVRIIRNQDPL